MYSSLNARGLPLERINGMPAQTYRLMKSARKIDMNLSASALVYEILSQLISVKKYQYKDLCVIFDLNVVAVDDEVSLEMIKESEGIYATSDEYPVIVLEDSIPASRENMYFSKPILAENNLVKVYVSHQWSRWLNDDGSKRSKGYLFFCIESFINICQKLGFEIKTNPYDETNPHDDSNPHDN